MNELEQEREELNQLQIPLGNKQRDQMLARLPTFPEVDAEIAANSARIAEIKSLLEP